MEHSGWPASAERFSSVVTFGDCSTSRAALNRRPATRNSGGKCGTSALLYQRISDQIRPRNFSPSARSEAGKDRLWNSPIRRGHSEANDPAGPTTGLLETPKRATYERVQRYRMPPLHFVPVAQLDRAARPSSLCRYSPPQPRRSSNFKRPFFAGIAPSPPQSARADGY
jgi:hypothetical protein